MAVRVQPRQLAFALPHAESLTRDNFLEGPANEAALSLIESWPDWPNRIMLLVGPEGSGKSHLAAIWAEQAGARSISAHALTPAAVPGALATGALVVEDLRPADFDERAMFHLLNLAREDEAFVLITGRVPPVRVRGRTARSQVAAARRTRRTAIAARRPVVSRLDHQVLRGSPIEYRRDCRELPRHPDRALLCRRPPGGRPPGYRGAAARPAGDPGAGCGSAAQRLIGGACCFLPP